MAPAVHHHRREVGVISHTPRPWKVIRTHRGLEIHGAGVPMPSGACVAEIRFRRSGAKRGTAV